MMLLLLLMYQPELHTDCWRGDFFLEDTEKGGVWGKQGV